MRPHLCFGSPSTPFIESFWSSAVFADKEKGVNLDSAGARDPPMREWRKWCRRRSNHDISQLLTRGKKKESTLALPNVGYNQGQRNEIVTVANVGFKMFVRNLQPLFDLVTIDKVEADCLEIYKKEKQKVYEELDKLPGKVSLSADRWVANGDMQYLCLIAYYIDDSWALKKKILNFLKIDPSRTEDSFSEVIMDSLRDWDIDRKLFSLTIDNHSSYDKIVCRIRDQLCQHRFLMCEGQLFDVRCAASTVKFLVQDVLEASSEITHKVRESIRLHRYCFKLYESSLQWACDLFTISFS
ncbi:unnamed protein product [Fraxinus pennsylvanica]|uniref:Uncharacterized protein n=1 Tax=Fraxinus pennsylvanica TaxID=56036 RepID=A0AAD2AA31_9LAMI|nr:unnamed protein product [Fraxinus pennsylvanica]